VLTSTAAAMANKTAPATRRARSPPSMAVRRRGDSSTSSYRQGAERM
jgi:hypothetical protein